MESEASVTRDEDIIVSICIELLSQEIIFAFDYTPLGVYSGAMQIKNTRLIRHLKIIEGQVRGLQEMIEKNTYCIDVITQASAIKQGLSNIEDALLEHHLGHCLIDQIQSGQTKKAKSEIIKVYRLKRK